MGKKFVKLLGLALGIAVANTIVLSPGLLGLDIGGSPLAAASGVTLLLASVLALLYGGYSLLLKQHEERDDNPLRTDEDYAEEMARYRRLKPFREDMAIALEQLERLNKKNATLLQILNRKFDSTELSYIKFTSAIRDVEKLFYLNVRGMLNRIRIYDGSEIPEKAVPGDGRFSAGLRQEIANVRNEHLSYIRNALGANEEILLKLDRLLLEISRLDVLDPEQLEHMSGMREIDALIKQTKLYKP